VDSLWLFLLLGPLASLLAGLLIEGRNKMEFCTSLPGCQCSVCRPIESDEARIAREWIEEFLDRAEDERVFGTPQSKPN
jgi:hypothetical protein